jgi:DNA repair protein RadC
VTKKPPSTEAGLLEAMKPNYLGHHERARARFNSVGSEALADYELFELPHS